MLNVLGLVSAIVTAANNILGVGIQYCDKQEEARKAEIEDMAKVIEDGGRAITEVATHIIQGAIEDKRETKLLEVLKDEGQN